MPLQCSDIDSMIILLCIIQKETASDMKYGLLNNRNWITHGDLNLGGQTIYLEQTYVETSVDITTYLVN